MMELYERELKEAKTRIGAAGRSADDFDFSMAFQEPDPDAAGMFTVRYDVGITSKATSKTLDAVGGIGLDWVGYFEAALKDGYFD